MRIFFSVGEPSGDLHGSNLIRRLKSQDPTIECVGYGGPKMAAAGCQLHFELTTLAVMFIGKAIVNLRTFLRLIAAADDFMRDNKVDAVVLIDFPGFNWWIARKAKKHGVPVFYYGVPQVWAWASWRVRKIRRLVDHVLCKLPFEVDWFAKRDCQATYVGHPYFDQLATQTYDQQFLAGLRTESQSLLTLLPGSRDQEVEQNLPVLLNTAGVIKESVPDVRIVIACFNEAQQEMARQQLADHRVEAELFTGRTPELMQAATVCLACSGSVSMELLYHRKPTVVVYKVSKLVMFAQAFVLRTKFITLVNLIATKDIRKTSWRPYDPDGADAESAVMPEYMTAGDPSKRMAAHAIGWLTDQESRDNKIAEMTELAAIIAKPGATRQAADFILQQLHGQTPADAVPLNIANKAGASSNHKPAA
jgi:lipid-A-disaccharide synthase